MIKPSEDPKVPAPEPAMPTPPSETEAPEDPAVHTQLDTPELSADEITLNPTITEPSSSANPPTTSDTDVLITGSRFVEPGTPTVLPGTLLNKKPWRSRKCVLISLTTLI